MADSLISRVLDWETEESPYSHYSESQIEETLYLEDLERAQSLLNSESINAYYSLDLNLKQMRSADLMTLMDTLKKGSDRYRTIETALIIILDIEAMQSIIITTLTDPETLAAKRLIIQNAIGGDYLDDEIIFPNPFQLENVDLSNLHFSTGKLSHCYLKGTNFSGASFNKECLRNADLTDAIITGEQLLGLDISTTIVPSGLLSQHQRAQQIPLKTRTPEDNCAIYEAINTLLASKDTDAESLSIKRNIIENVINHCLETDPDIFGPDHPLNLINVDLSGLNLGILNLRNADLTGAEVNGQQLLGVDISTTIVSTQTLSTVQLAQMIPAQVRSDEDNNAIINAINRVLASDDEHNDIRQIKRTIMENASRYQYLNHPLMFGPFNKINLSFKFMFYCIRNKLK